MPNGPSGVEAATPGAVAHLGEHPVEPGDVVVGDADGVILLPGDRAEEVLRVAGEIASTETAQADAMREGTSLREQLAFRDYLAERERDPGYTLRDHLKKRGGAIER
jgi:regulator of RNase E activity RraA